MVNLLTVINYLGDDLSINLLNPFNVGMAITKIEGLGPVTADIITNDSATIDGAVFNSSRLSTRNIVITMKLLGTETNNQSIEATRQEVYKYFPVKKKVWLIFETDKRSAMIDGIVESDEPDIFSDWETTQISVICPSPFFEALEQQETILPKNAVDPTTINYEGEVETGINILIDLSGPVTQIVLEDQTTSERLTIDTDSIATKYGAFSSGDKIEISTVKGSKKALFKRGDNSYNIINYLDRNPSWFELRKGDNKLIYYANTPDQNNIKVTIINKVLYEGL